MNIYGFISNGVHYDSSKTEHVAKNYATRNGLDNVSIRVNCGYNVAIIAKKVNNKWVNL